MEKVIKQTLSKEVQNIDRETRSCCRALHVACFWQTRPAKLPHATLSNPHTVGVGTLYLAIDDQMMSDRYDIDR